MQERRRYGRREADRELQERIKQLEGAADRRGDADTKEAQRKRRRTIRHNCKVLIQMMVGFSPGDSDDWSVEAIKIRGRILDLSADGASLFTQQPFETGQELRLTIELPDRSQICTNAKVRWIKAVPQKDAYASGVQFIHVSKKDNKKLGKFLKELDATVGL